MLPTLELSLQIAKSEFKLKNEGSYLGILWYLLNPLLVFTLLFFIFSDRLGTDIPYYPLYLLLGILLFNFFQSTTTESTQSMSRENSHLIKSINFPRKSLIISTILKNLLTHCFELVIFCGILIFFHFNILWIFYYIPILVLFALFTFGISIALSAPTVFFTDLNNIWSFAVRLLWFGTPIFYAIAGQTRLFYLNIGNPLYYFITAARDVIIYHTAPEAWIIGGMMGFSALSFVIGLAIFGVLNKKIAEYI